MGIHADPLHAPFRLPSVADARLATIARFRRRLCADLAVEERPRARLLIHASLRSLAAAERRLGRPNANMSKED